MEHRVRAIEAVASAVRRSREAEPSRRANLRAALEQVSQDTRRHSEATVRTLLEVVEGMMLRPADPSEIPWNVFRLFETSGSETAWTKWLAAMLSPEQGSQLSALVWRSLCDAIVQQKRDPCPVNPRERLATRETWCEERNTPLLRGCVSRECHDPKHGRTDIEVRAPGIFLVLENKLDAGWHDGAGDRQPVRYRRIGIKGCTPTQQLGLVVLVKKPKLRPALTEVANAHHCEVDHWGGRGEQSACIRSAWVPPEDRKRFRPAVFEAEISRLPGLFKKIDRAMGQAYRRSLA